MAHTTMPGIHGVGTVTISRPVPLGAIGSSECCDITFGGLEFGKEERVVLALFGAQGQLHRALFAACTRFVKDHPLQ